jgi:hypothetical protein
MEIAWSETNPHHCSILLSSSTIHRQRGSVGHRVWAFARKTGFVEAFQSDLEKLFALSLTQIYRCSPKNSDGQVSPEKCQS